MTGVYTAKQPHSVSFVLNEKKKDRSIFGTHNPNAKLERYKRHNQNTRNSRRQLQLGVGDNPDGNAINSITIDEPYSDGEPPVNTSIAELDINCPININGQEFEHHRNLNNQESSEISPPPAKIRRMQAGVRNFSKRTATHSGKSVAERLRGGWKDANSKDNCSNGNSKEHTAPSCSTTCPSTRTIVPLADVKPIRQRPQLNECQRNTLRVINQYLRELGMHNTVDALVEESDCREEDVVAVRLRAFIKSHEWYEALMIIDDFKDKINPRDHLTVRVALLEELMKKFFIVGDYQSVLLVLQHQYPRDKEFADRRRFFVMMLADDPNEVADFLKKQEKEADYSNLTNLIEEFLPPNFMLTSGRLDQLLNQSFETQLRNCSLHIGYGSKIDEPKCILRDHHCTNQNFPCRTTQIIQDHETEVWTVKFSPCGNYLASAGKSGIVFIWEVKDPQKLKFYNRYVINDEIEGISSLSWSNDSRLLACGATEHRNSGIYILKVDEKSAEDPIEPIRISQDKFSVADFFPSPGHKLVCGDARGNFSMINVDEVDHSDNSNDFEGFRIRALVCLKDGKTVLAADSLNRIRSYDFEQHFDQTLIEETSPIVTFTVDKNEKHCLITTKDNGIRMWCLETHTLIQTFLGSVHSEIVVNACFGGPNDNFIASGCERSNRLMIWKISEKKPIKYLDGHHRHINTVDWNPKYQSMLVSGSDDNTIRVWSTAPIGNASKDQEVALMNGTKTEKKKEKDVQKHRNNKNKTTPKKNNSKNVDQS